MSERSDFRLIGDPHITRKFVQNVPLARRGEREKKLFEDFKARLYQGTERYVIMVGDLFEKPITSISDLHETMKILLTAAARQPKRQFLMMCGNHDISPQKNNPGSFDVLLMLNGFFDNLHFINRPTVVNRIALFPWEWDRTALEQLDEVEAGSFDVAIGHWDLVAYDEMHMDHYCPAAKLVEMGAKEIYSGHWHVAGDYKVEGHTVHCTGSMQPMTHAEDPDKKMYVTLTLEEYEEMDKAKLKDKYVRVIVEDGDIVDPLEDCLGFKVQKNVKYSEEDYEPVEVDNFDSKEVIKRNLQKHDVPEDVGSFIMERIDVDD